MEKDITPLMLRRKYSHPHLWIKTLVTMMRSVVRGVLERYPLADGAGSLSCEPLLIISAGRSGTTLLRSMLVAGGQIAIPPETQILHKLPVKFLSTQGLGWDDLSRLVISSFESHPLFHEWDASLHPAYERAIALPQKERSLVRLIDIVYTTYAAQKFPAATMWGDQSPLHTLFLPWIQPIFPKAKYLHLLRDGRDVVASAVEKEGPANLAPATYRWAKSIECVAKLRNDLGDNQLLEIRYEDLVMHPEQTLQSVSNYAGISYSQKMLDYWKLPSTVEHKYHEHHRNLNQPVFTASIGKWKERLTQEQQRYVLGKISKLLENLGYPL